MVLSGGTLRLTGAPATEAPPLPVDNLVLHLDPGQLGLATGSPVATWGDVSGSGNDVSQVAADAQPTLVEGVLNGLPVVRFDGGDFLSLDGGVLAGDDDDYTYVAVWNPTQQGVMAVMEQAGPGNGARASLLAVNSAYGFNGQSNDLHWLVPYSANAMIVDDRGTVVDFVVWGYSPAEIASMEVTINGFTVRADGIWTGAAAPADGETSNSLQRRGTEDHDSASDWAFVEPESLGQQNADLVAPFAAPGAPGLGFDIADSGISGAIQLDVAADMHGVNSTLWARIPFEASDSAVLKTMELRMRYDDGFVAYINGTEVARRNAPEAVHWDSQATSGRSPTEALQVEEFNLLSHYREIGATSYMRENLAYEWMNEVGVAAPLTFHMHLRQNGTFYGLYSFVEQIDDTFLQRNGFNPDGAMYKALQDGTLAPNPTTGNYRKATQKDEPWTDFVEFANALSSPNRFRFVSDNVDLAQLVNEMASQTIMANHDRLIKNYYMYLEPETLQWHRFPWDMDQPFAVGQKLTGDQDEEYIEVVNPLAVAVDISGWMGRPASPSSLAR